MSVYLPSSTSGLGSYLINRLEEEPAPAGVPLYQVESQRVPVISALVPGNTIYRMLSFVTGPRSIPMCRSNEKFSHLSPMRLHNVTHAEIVPYGSIDEKVSKDCYSDCKGTPFEHGYGMLLTSDSQRVHSGFGMSLQVGAQFYEVYLMLAQLKSFLQCYPQMKKHEYPVMDLTNCYEPADRTSVRRSLLNRESLSVHDVYENIARFMCGSSCHSHGQILSDFGFVQERCLSSTKLPLPHTTIRYIEFKPHRVVSTIVLGRFSLKKEKSSPEYLP